MLHGQGCECQTADGDWLLKERTRREPSTESKTHLMRKRGNISDLIRPEWMGLENGKVFLRYCRAPCSCGQVISSVFMSGYDCAGCDRDRILYVKSKHLLWKPSAKWEAVLSICVLDGSLQSAFLYCINNICLVGAYTTMLFIDACTQPTQEWTKINIT